MIRLADMSDKRKVSISLRAKDSARSRRDLGMIIVRGPPEAFS